ncbi:hypothetical protein DU506_00735 [Vreelandella rituensis]|uniref:TraD/TraG TraM recognition site domain-containing protein n=3 Tax=Vreelandella rituensis TaxID=2282306 RepID=A0A368UBI5_9GAMM|nr:hypothetical protein DU506_00735 [Halomonas rituensis]
MVLYVIDTNQRLRKQDPFGRGTGPYIKRTPGKKKTVEEWSVLSTPSHRGGDGIWPMGNNFNTGEEVVAADNLVRTHMVLSGTTGSGKTVTMTSAFAYTAFVSGSGMVMIDGKADPKTWFDLFAMAVAAGRADDFLVLNFVVGASQQADYSFYSAAEKALWEEFRAVESNTFNLFGTGNSDTLFEIGASLLGSEASGENKMWVERAEALLRSLLKGLVELRDKGRIQISVKSLQEYMSLEKLSELEKDPDIDKTARDQIAAVLNEIPGYRDAMSIDDPQQRSMALADQPSKQFGFLLMQFSALYAMLIGTYGHIANVQFSDIYFPDIVYGRRILLCQLPALEKSPNSMSQLGRMALSGIKSALSQSISGRLTGLKADIVDRRPTNSLRAMLLIYDEAGSYLQAGTADVASQARSLGVFNVFSGQEWASFKSAGDLEAQRIVSNSGLKVILKTEDKETCDEFINAVGETQILRSGGKRFDKGRWVEDSQSLEKVPRVTVQEITNLAEGQAFMKWRDTLIPLRMPHVEPPAVVRAQRNDLVPIPGSMATDREQMRNKRDVTEEILEQAMPALNLVGLCRELGEAAEEPAQDSWRLMEKLVRYAHKHQVIIPWEESPPPAGRLDSSEIHAVNPSKGALALDYLIHTSTERHEELEKARKIVRNGRPSQPPYNPQEESLSTQGSLGQGVRQESRETDAVAARIASLLDNADAEHQPLPAEETPTPSESTAAPVEPQPPIEPPAPVESQESETGGKTEGAIDKKEAMRLALSQFKGTGDGSTQASPASDIEPEAADIHVAEPEPTDSYEPADESEYEEDFEEDYEEDYEDNGDDEGAHDDIELSAHDLEIEHDPSADLGIKSTPGHSPTGLLADIRPAAKKRKRLSKLD